MAGHLAHRVLGSLHHPVGSLMGLVLLSSPALPTRMNKDLGQKPGPPERDAVTFKKTATLSISTLNSFILTRQFWRVTAAQVWLHLQHGSWFCSTRAGKCLLACANPSPLQEVPDLSSRSQDTSVHCAILQLLHCTEGVHKTHKRSS